MVHRAGGTRRPIAVGRGVGAALALALVALGTGCGSSGEGVAAPREALDVVLHGPGSPIADGLVVPEGAALAGTSFAWPDEQGDRRTTVLTIDGDPFRVFDALAEQVRTVVDAPLPGSSDSCWWREEAEGAPQRIGADDAGPPDALRCGAIASTEVDGALVAYELSLEWDETGPAFVELIRQPWPADLGPVAEGEQAMAIAGWEDGTYDDLAEPTTTPVPAGASAHLVEPGDPDVTAFPEAGTPFGPTVHCFDRGDARFEAPPGTTGIVALRYQAILAVDDALAAQADLRRQLEVPNPQRDGHPETTTAVLADGTEVTTYTHGIEAGGDSCGVETSPDGRHLRISYAPGG